MKLKILYFGAIAEHTNCTEELYTLPVNCTVSQLENILKKKHSSLEQLSYQIAVNQNINKENPTLSEHCEVALLPPFSGG